MKKLIIHCFLLISSLIHGQSITLLEKIPNYYDFKIQTFAGLGINSNKDFLPAVIGLEGAYKHNCFGVKYSEGFGFAMFWCPAVGYKTLMPFYGWRISSNRLSTSLSVGAGITEFITRGKYKYTSGSGFIGTAYYEEIKTKYPSIEFMTKTNFFRTLSGISFIGTCNINMNQIIFEAHVALQLGYEWDDKKTKDPFKD